MCLFVVIVVTAIGRGIFFLLFFCWFSFHFSSSNIFRLFVKRLFAASREFISLALKMIIIFLTDPIHGRYLRMNILCVETEKGQINRDR